MINTTTNYQQYSSNIKPGLLKSVGKGIGTEIKSLIPIYNLYMVGDEFYKIDSAKENLKNIKNGSLEYEDKNWFQKTAKGLGRAIVSFIPIIGTYCLGKTKNEKENLKDEIAGYNTQKAGIIKNYFTGLWERIKLAIPFYNVYYIGKESLEATNIQNDINKIYLETSNASFNSKSKSFDTQLKENINLINTCSNQGLIDDKTTQELNKIIEQLEQIENNTSLSEEEKTQEKIKLSNKLCTLTEKI